MTNQSINEEQVKAVEKLHNIIQSGVTDTEELDTALWNAIEAYQNYLFHTKSGLAFFYTIKCNKQGIYTGELIISRKEGSKTLTKSSIMLAYHKVLSDTKNSIPPEYKGPKAIGQIFGISYIYSIFWHLGLIKVPLKIEDRLGGKI